MCTELILGILPRNLVPGLVWVFGVVSYRETDSRSRVGETKQNFGWGNQNSSFSQTKFMSPTMINSAAGLNLDLQPCRQAANN